MEKFSISAPQLPKKFLHTDVAKNVFKGRIIKKTFTIKKIFISKH